MTMIVQGLTLPYLIRRFHLMTVDEEAEEQRVYKEIKHELSEFALQHLEKNYGKALEEQPILQKIASKWKESKMLTEDSDMTSECKIIYLNILSQQRKWLVKKYLKDSKIDEGIIRRHLHQLDMEEEKIKFL
jgi:CPA1 family monovalent cation:H+ antiporter